MTSLRFRIPRSKNTDHFSEMSVAYCPPYNRPRIFFSETPQGRLFLQYIHSKASALMIPYTIPPNVVYFQRLSEAVTDPWQYFYALLFRLIDLIDWSRIREKRRKLPLTKNSSSTRKLVANLPKESAILEAEEPYILINDLSMEAREQCNLIVQTPEFDLRVVTWIKIYGRRLHVVLGIPKPQYIFCREFHDAVSLILIYYMHHDIPKTTSVKNPDLTLSTSRAAISPPREPNSCAAIFAGFWMVLFLLGLLFIRDNLFAPF